MRRAAEAGSHAARHIPESDILESVLCTVRAVDGTLARADDSAAARAAESAAESTERQEARAACQRAADAFDAFVSIKQRRSNGLAASTHDSHDFSEAMISD